MADVLAVFHLVWVFFNLTGFLWARRWPLAGKIHVGTLGLTLGFFIFLGGCPLTRWEWALRGRPAAEESFIVHWFSRFGGEGLSPEIVGWGTVVLFVVSLSLHVLLPWRRLRRDRGKMKTGGPNARK